MKAIFIVESDVVGRVSRILRQAGIKFQIPLVDVTVNIESSMNKPKKEDTHSNMLKYCKGLGYDNVADAIHDLGVQHFMRKFKDRTPLKK